MNTMKIKDMGIDILLDGRITAVIGPANSGKTFMAKKIMNKINNKDIFIDDVCIDEYDITFLRNNIVVILNDDTFNGDFVSEELYFYMEKLGYRIDEISKKIEEISKYFKISSILDRRIETLNNDKKMIVKLLSYLIIKPKLLVIDTILSYIDKKTIGLLFKYVKENGITLVLITSDSSLLLECDDVVILNDMKCVLNSRVEDAIKGNTIIPYIGMDLPFIVDLSHNLILYELIDEVYIKDRKLVSKLWK